MKIKIGLVPRLIIAIILGILVGQYFPLWFCRGIVTLSGIFSSFLKFVIPLMILAYVTMGIADLSQGAGKLLLIPFVSHTAPLWLPEQHPMWYPATCSPALCLRTLWIRLQRLRIIPFPDTSALLFPHCWILFLQWFWHLFWDSACPI